MSNKDGNKLKSKQKRNNKKNDVKKSLPPRIKKFIESEYRPTVDKMLDTGISYAKISEYLKKQGFPISATYISRYNKYRKALLTEKENLDKFMNKSPVSKVVIESNINKNDGFTSGGKLKNDLEFLDEVIQTGADTLRTKLKNQEVEIELEDVFEAIKIKNTITDGALAGMTTYGIENLTEMTESKYMAIIKHLFKYIPTDQKDKILKELDVVEDAFYRNTDYYEDYLRSQGYTDKKIKDKMNEKSG